MQFFPLPFCRQFSHHPNILRRVGGFLITAAIVFVRPKFHLESSVRGWFSERVNVQIRIKVFLINDHQTRCQNCQCLLYTLNICALSPFLINHHKWNHHHSRLHSIAITGRQSVTGEIESSKIGRSGGSIYISRNNSQSILSLISIEKTWANYSWPNGKRNWVARQRLSCLLV